MGESNAWKLAYEPEKEDFMIIKRKRIIPEEEKLIANIKKVAEVEGTFGIKKAKLE